MFSSLQCCLQLCVCVMCACVMCARVCSTKFVCVCDWFLTKALCVAGNGSVRVCVSLCECRPNKPAATIFLLPPTVNLMKIAQVTYIPSLL